MINWDKWQEILNSLKKQKLRTSLTAFGVFWGIFMLVILLGFGGGFGYKVEADFRDNNNVLLMWSANSTQLPYMGLGKGRRINFKLEDVDLIRKKVTSVKMVDGKNGLNGWGNPQPITHGKINGSFAVTGTHVGWLPYEFPSISRVIEGRYINALDEDERRKVAVIGSRVKDVLFKNENNPIGKTINIRGINFQVVGVYQNFSSEDAEQNNTSVFIPNATLQQAFNVSNFDLIFFTPKTGYTSEEVESQVKQLLYRQHKIHPDDKGVLGGWNHEKFYKQQQSLVTGIIGFSWMVAIGTIIAGVIGVGNIMLVIVKERTREIGLRKALGATPTKISLMIVHESLVITMIAGYTGLVAGVLLLEAIKAILIKMGKGEGMFASPFIDIGTALIALAVLVISGVIASLLPAIKAASVNPILALQDE